MLTTKDGGNRRRETSRGERDPTGSRGRESLYSESVWGNSYRTVHRAVPRVDGGATKYQREVSRPGR